MLLCVFMNDDLVSLFFTNRLAFSLYVILESGGIFEIRKAFMSHHFSNTQLQ